MPPSLPTLPLLLYGDQASSAWSLAGDDLRHWSAAFDDWLACLERDHNPVYRQKHRHAWADFLAFCPKPPWEVTQEDLERWVAHHTARGLLAATICNKLSSLSHFYDFAAAHLPASTPPFPCREGGPGGLGPFFNPLRNFRPLRRKDYSRIIYLAPDEARLLLSAIDRETSVLAKRDYALILAHLLTGLESGRLIALRWGDIKGDGAGIVLPEPVLAAVDDYLSASGRLPGIRPEHYLFAPLADPLHKPSGLQPEDWNPARPVTRVGFSRSLRIYARCAGLRPDLINPRSLHYSAVVLRIEAGDTAEELAAFLGRHDPYQVELAAWRLVEEEPPDPLLDASHPASPTPRNRSGGGPLGNLKGLKHGIYASHLPPEDFEGVDELPPDSLTEEIRVVRVGIRRTLARLDKSQTLDESCRFLDLLGKSAVRLAKMMKTQHELSGGRDDGVD